MHVTKQVKRCIYQRIPPRKSQLFQIRRNASLAIENSNLQNPSEDAARTYSKKHKPILQQPIEIVKTVEAELKIKELDQWYSFSRVEALAAAEKVGKGYEFKGLLTRNGDSLVNTLLAVYAEHPWKIERFKFLPRKYISNPENQIRILKMLEPALGVKQPHDWYAVNQSGLLMAADKISMKKTVQSMFTHYFSNSIMKVFQLLYPNEQMDEMKFGKVSKVVYMQLETRERICKLLEKSLGVMKPEDWYKVSIPDTYDAAERIGVKRNWMSLLNHQYSNSMLKFVKDMYPSIEWKDHLFKTTPLNFYKNVENHRIILRAIEQELKMKSPQNEWYSKTFNEILQAAEKAGVKRQFERVVYVCYNGSLVRALKMTFPEYQLTELKFNRLPLFTYKNPDFLKEAVKTLEKTLQIVNKEDWYRVSLKQLAYFSKLSLFQKYGGLKHVLPSIYPDFDWKIDNFSSRRVKKSQQRLLLVYLRTLLINDTTTTNSNNNNNNDGDSNGVEIIEEYLSDLKYSANSSERIQLDIFVPKYNLAFEYNGEQHYLEVGFFGNFREYQLLDASKRRACNEAGITLISIPYTWNSSIESIAATIRHLRPDIPLYFNDMHSVMKTPPLPQPTATKMLTQEELLVPTSELVQYKKSSYFSTSSSSTYSSNAPYLGSIDRILMHPSLWSEEDNRDPTGWFISEKLDGIRCYWNGNQFYSRQGRVFSNIPEHFKRGLPRHICLDGELWIDRGKYEDVNMVIRSKNKDLWRSVKFCIFDIVRIDFDNMPVDERMLLQTFVDAQFQFSTEQSHLIPFATRHFILQTLQQQQSYFSNDNHLLVEQEICKSRHHLNEVFSSITSNKGEGVVLRSTDAPYTPGWVPHLCKLKKYQETEVKFIKVDTKSYALLCEQADGQHVLVGCYSQLLSNPPKPNTILTVKHTGVHKTTGKLRNPVYFRIRLDQNNDI